jgi:hypothetical protein
MPRETRSDESLSGPSLAALGAAILKTTTGIEPV